jgi:hypothetical protein
MFTFAFSMLPVTSMEAKMLLPAVGLRKLLREL